MGKTESGRGQGIGIETARESFAIGGQRVEIAAPAIERIREHHACGEIRSRYPGKR